MTANTNFIASTIQIEIPSFSEKYVNKRTCTFYWINVTNLYSNKKWAFEKEFEDIDELQKQLCKILPNVPEIEGKSLFKVTAYDAWTKRRVYLEMFLKECCVRKDILLSDYFKEFLDLNTHAPELTCNTPTKLSNFNDFPWGIRDYLYLEKEGILFIICSDMNITSRVDAYITNVNLPWEDKSDTHISVGAFFAFRVTFDLTKGFKFEKLFAKSFPEQTGCINYDAESNSINIGWDSGRIVFYKLDPNSLFTHYELYIDFKPHSARVMGVHYDSQTGYIYSCSSDKRFLITEIGYLDSSSEIIEGKTFGFTNMIYEKQSQQFFLTNEVGMVFVYLAKSFPPTLVNMIQTSTQYSLRGWCVDTVKCYIFTASQDGKICILDRGNPGKKQFIKEISNFGGNVKWRVIQYVRESNEVITGDQNGRVTIWSLKTGKSIYAWEAHEGAITKISYLPEHKVLITAGKDKGLKTWRLPEKWINEDLKKFEDNEIKTMSDTMAMMKIQKSLERPENYNSDEDSLNGWDYKPECDEEM